MIESVLLILFGIALLYQGYRIHSLKKAHKTTYKNLENDSKELIMTSHYASIGENAKYIIQQWREPLNDIRSSLMLQAGASSEHFAQTLKTNINLIHHLTEAIDTFSNFLTQHPSAHFTLDEQLKKVLKITEFLFQSSHIELSYEIDYNHKIEGDANEFIHAMLNLLLYTKINFDEHTVDTPHIIIVISGFEETCSITVSNNGGGIKVNLLNSIFSRSMSLCLSKHIFEKRFDGSIHVENTNDGSCFSITLPYAHRSQNFINSDEAKEMLVLERVRLFTHQLFTVAHTQQQLERWKYVFDQAHWGIAIHQGLSETFEMTNQMMSSLYGYTPEEFKTISVSDLFIPESHAILPKIKQYANERGYAIFKAIHQRKNGSTFSVSIELIVVKDNTGEVLYHIANIWDLTNQKISEQNLQLKRFALNHIKDAVFLVDDTGHFRYINEGACLALGYSRSELLTMNVSSLDVDYPRERWIEHWNTLKQRLTLTIETHHKRKDGSIFPVEVSANYIEFEGIGYNMAIARNITSRKLMEAEKENRIISSITENSPDIIFRIDTEFHFIYMNSVAKVTFYDDISQNIKKSLREFITPENVKYFKEVLTTGESKDIDIILNRNNTESYLFFKIAAERNSDNDITGAIAIGRDLTERRTARNALQQSEQKYRTLVENANDFIIRYDHDARIIYLNPQLEKIMDTTLEEIAGKTPTELSETIYHDYEIILRKVISTGQNSDTYIILPDIGEGHRYHHVQIIAERDTERNVIGAMTIGRDVSELKRLNKTLEELNISLENRIQERTAELQASEETFRAIVENSPDIITRYDLSMRRTYVNPMMEFLLGKPRDEILGKTPREFSPLPDVELFEQMFNTVIKGKSEFTYEGPYMTAWGESRWGKQRIIPIVNENRDVTSVIVVGHDIPDHCIQCPKLFNLANPAQNKKS